MERRFPPSRIAKRSNSAVLTITNERKVTPRGAEIAWNAIRSGTTRVRFESSAFLWKTALKLIR